MSFIHPAFFVENTNNNTTTTTNNIAASYCPATAELKTCQNKTGKKVTSIRSATTIDYNMADGQLDAFDHR